MFPSSGGKTTNFSTDLFASSWYSVFTMYNLRLLSTSQCPLSRLRPGLPSRTRCCCWRWSGRRSSRRWSRSRWGNHHRNSVFELHINIRTKRSDRWLWSKREGRRWRILQRTDYKDILEHHRKPHLIILIKILMITIYIKVVCIMWLTYVGTDKAQWSCKSSFTSF